MERYLAFEQVEVGNADRVAAYLRNGLAGGDSYITHVGGCTCAAMGGPFGSPLTDPAPWYYASRPESADFLGFMPTLIDVPPVVARSVKARAGGGQVLGPLANKGRTVLASGYLFAASKAGMDYGRWWMDFTLSGGNIIGFLNTTTLLSSCASVGGRAPQRYLFRSGAIDGPLLAPVPENSESLIQKVSFQIASELAFVFEAPITIASGSLVSATEVCGSFSVDFPGSAASRITLDAGPSVDLINVIIAAIPSSGSCPGTNPPIRTFAVPNVPAGTTLVMDGVSRIVTVTDNTTGQIVGGFDAISTAGDPFNWLDIERNAIATCICVTPTTAGAGATYLLEQINREF